jgi:hypothetical chaperone protein
MPASADQHNSIGIDFGTTNSTIARLDANGQVHLATFSFLGETIPSYRSVLYFEQSQAASGMKRAHGWTGPEAIEHYLHADEKGRLIQSLKSHLPSRTLTGTEVFGRRHRIEDLVARILSDLRKHAEKQFGHSIHTATVGRPVRFVGADSEEDDDYAVERLRTAFTQAGFEHVDFEMEPLAAAYAYESTLDRDQLILIADFGGGTSDFSLLRVGPKNGTDIRKRGRRPEDLLGNSGLGLAGDAFDARIVRKLVSPALGSNSEIRSFNKILPAVPAWIYANLERWHYLSFLRTNNVREILKGALARALEPEKIEALIAVIDGDLGYQLHQAVQQVKFELSRSPQAEFHFRDSPLHPSIDLRIPVTRAEFETWIADDLASIEHSVDSLLKCSSVAPQQVDAVFLTGGSAFVPAVRRIFSSRFGQDRLRGGNEFTSVAHGLALSAATHPR